MKKTLIASAIAMTSIAATNANADMTLRLYKNEKKRRQFIEAELIAFSTILPYLTILEAEA